METGLDKEISDIAKRVRRTDLLWAAGLGGGAIGILAVTSTVPWQLAGLAWLVILLGLAVRYYTANVTWSVPVQRAVKTELALYQRLRAVLNAVPDPVIMLKDDGIVELANPAAGEFLGAEPEGQYLSSVFRAPVVSLAQEDAAKSGQPQMADFVVGGPIDRHCRVYVTPLDSDPDEDIEATATENRLLVFISDLSTERRLEQMRSDFIANASHELRTPLASMLGFIETLKGHAKDDPASREKFLDIMQEQAERMLRLVKDLMSLSSIELNEHVPPDGRIDLLLVAEDVRASLAPLAESCSGIVEIRNNFIGQDQFIAGDRDELIQVIQNLTDNALKYGGDNPRVTIVTGKGEPPPLAGGELRTGETAALISSRIGLTPEDLVYLQVRDAGPGIKRMDLPRLTERFYRVDVEESRARGGTGLGLAIVKHIISRHKGGLQIESKEGHGSAFTCFFRPLDA